MAVKRQIRVVGIDDVHFARGKEKKVAVIGIIFRGASHMDNLLSTFVTVDGSDGTSKIASMIKRSRAAGQRQVLILDGITVAGFNVIDIRELSRRTKFPVIAVMRKKPDFAAIERALKKLPGSRKKLEAVRKAGKVFSCEISNKEASGRIYFQLAGLAEEKARQILRLTTVHGLVPEPLRVAHIIGQGIKMGESRGRA